MKLKKKMAAALAAAMLCQSFAGGYIEQTQVQAAAGAFAMPSLPEMSAGALATMPAAGYKTGITFMYFSNDTKVVDVAPNGALTAKGAGTTTVSVSVLYNYTTVGSEAVPVKVEESEAGLVIKDEQGNVMDKIAFPDPVLKVSTDNESVAKAELTAEDELIITAVGAGSANVKLTGEIGTITYAEGVIPVQVAAKDEPTQSEAPVSEQPTQSEAPVSDEPAQSEAPVSEQPVQSEAPSSEQPAQSETPSSEAPSDSPQVIKGDIDGNGRVELADAQLALKAALKLQEITDADKFQAADVDDNKKIELSDAQYILKKALKLV